MGKNLYCWKCGIKQDTSRPSYRIILSDETVSEKEVIEGYFYSGFSYETIIHFLSKYSGIAMSMSTLKRRLSLYDLKRNKKEIDLSDVEGVIRHELIIFIHWIHCSFETNLKCQQMRKALN